MTEAMTLGGVVLSYHQRTKHGLEGYAAGPETLDWTAQPDPFREYRGARRIALPLPAEQLDARFCDLYTPGAIDPLPLSLDSVAALLQLSLAISAWKEYGPDRWALRCTPSSGNLHPTEAYVVAHRISGLGDGVYHYASREHSLEQRCTHAPHGDTLGRLWIGLSSIHWREAWKYGERAFRYCQLDVGHALGALRYAAGTLGWTLRPTDIGATELAALLGLDRDTDFADAEREEPELLLEVFPGPVAHSSDRQTPCVSPAASQHWAGQANRLDPHPMYRWPIIDEVATASRRARITPTTAYSADYPPLAAAGTEPARQLILRRRSAQRFDARFILNATTFYHLLDALLPRPIAPWDLWPYAPRLHPLLFVHRVEGLEAGLYALPRRPQAERDLRAALRDSFIWERPADCPAHLPLYRLLPNDCRTLARTLSCHQAIAADGCFSLSMLAEFDNIVRDDPWRYRQLHWEAGLLGQILYLEAEAAGVRGTGIGCYFDDAVHDILGLRDRQFQSLYHFTVGRALTDDRITTLPPYPARGTDTESPS